MKKILFLGGEGWRVWVGDVDGFVDGWVEVFGFGEFRLEFGKYFFIGFLGFWYFGNINDDYSVLYGEWLISLSRLFGDVYPFLSVMYIMAFFSNPICLSAQYQCGFP